MTFKKSIRIIIMWGIGIVYGMLLLNGCAGTTVIRTAPPPLPLYEQPYCPGSGFIWVPGYWAYGPNGYYWVPGLWELAPQAGWLWTPGYWGWYDRGYYWHPGYWCRHVGFYGGVNYGYGYYGTGYSGGYWKQNVFYYNTAVTKVNVTVVHTTYNQGVSKQAAPTAAASYNGGNGGTTAQPTKQELAAARERHIATTPRQKHHILASRANRELLVSANHGQPRAELLAKEQVLEPKNPEKLKGRKKPYR